MDSTHIPTQFAPAARLSTDEIRSQAAFFSNLTYLCPVADALPNPFLALNTCRQIVFANHAMANLAGKKDPKELYGLRPGEALHCIHSGETEGGCGTTEFCRTCGAARAILAAIGGKKEVQECRITAWDGESLDLRAYTSPCPNGNPFIFFSVEDISHEKRRQALERIFFHDVLNTAGGVQGLAGLLTDETDPKEAGELIALIQTGTQTLMEEINAQKALNAAETGDLTLQLETVRTDHLLQEVAAFYENHVASKDRGLQLHSDTESLEFTTDPILLRRVLGNMIKNALEASSPGQAVTLGATGTDGKVEIWVHNQGMMPRDSQLQVFQRSFSTKGSGRGLGTYSIRLLTERYLKGRVAFTSTEAEGTIFRLSLPVSPREDR